MKTQEGSETTDHQTVSNLDLTSVEKSLKGALFEFSNGQKQTKQENPQVSSFDYLKSFTC